MFNYAVQPGETDADGAVREDQQRLQIALGVGGLTRGSYSVFCSAGKLERDRTHIRSRPEPR